MESEKRVSVSGRSREDIADQYINLMSEGFDLTISEMEAYLRCSYGYAQKNIAPHIQYINVNNLARTALFDWHREQDKYRHLFTKRLLFLRKDFERYILDKAKLVINSERYYFSDLSQDAQQRLMSKTKTKNKNEARKALATLVKKHVGDISDIRDKSIVQQLSKIPDELYSLKDLVQEKFRYNIDAYRFIDKYGIPKIQLGSLIRYRIEDIKDVDDIAFTLPLSTEVDKKALLSYIEDNICYK